MQQVRCAEIGNAPPPACRGARAAPHSISLPRQSRGGGAPLGATRQSCLLAEAGALAIGHRALRRSTAAFFEHRATLSAAPAPPSASSWRGDRFYPPGGAPGRPAPACLPVVGAASADLLGPPRKYQSRISGPFLRPAPLSRRLMTAPLGEQGERIISEVFCAGINYFRKQRVGGELRSPHERSDMRDRSRPRIGRPRISLRSCGLQSMRPSHPARSFAARHPLPAKAGRGKTRCAGRRRDHDVANLGDEAR